MTKTTHTHRGTCQACGNVQAVDNKVGTIAKHGYTVEYGAFQFVCNAAGYVPAEQSVLYTHTTITTCLIQATWHDAQVVLLRDGVIVPETFERWNKNKVKTKYHTNGTTYQSKGDYDTLPIAVATPDELKARVDSQILHHEQQAAGLRSHVAFLRTKVLTRLGQPLYANEVLTRPRYGKGFQFSYEGHTYILTRPAYSVYGDKHIGWYVIRVGEEHKPELRWTTRSLNEATTPKKVEAGASQYPTKVARKNALDKLNRKYDKARNKLQGFYLSLPEGLRTDAKNAVYWGPHDLCHWRPKHAEAALREFPEAAEVVAEINALVKEREAIKAAP